MNCPETNKLDNIVSANVPEFRRHDAVSRHSRFSCWIARGGVPRVAFPPYGEISSASSFRFFVSSSANVHFSLKNQAEKFTDSREKERGSSVAVFHGEALKICLEYEM